MNITKPDDPCWCGSPRAYRNCHMRIDSCGPHQRLAEARIEYAEKWEHNANNIEVQNGYEWMASLLKPYKPRRILDIGCGLGNGIAALSMCFPEAKIISLDENIEIIQRAKLRLESSGSTVSVIRRLMDKATSDRSHTLRVDLGKLRVGGRIDLIESDVLDDSELDQFLMKQKKFDAITLWLIGSHLLRYHECDYLRGDINSPDEYRIHVQSIAFAWATRFLNPGGVLHLVDRGPFPIDVSMREAVLLWPRQLAAMVNGISLRPPEYRGYHEADTPTKIEMVNELGNLASPSDLALISIIAVKK